MGRARPCNACGMSIAGACSHPGCPRRPTITEAAESSKPEIAVVETIVSVKATISHKALCKAFNLPADATITIEVPSGGDYSGMDLSIEENPINVQYKEIQNG